MPDSYVNKEVFAKAWAETVYKKEPVLTPQEFWNIYQDFSVHSYLEAKEYLFGVINDLSSSVASAAITSGISYNNMAKALNVSPSNFSRTTKQDTIHSLPFCACVRAATLADASLHDYLLRTKGSLVKPLRKYQLLINYLADFDKDRHTDIYKKLWAKYHDNTVNYRYDLSQKDEDALLKRRIIDYCSDKAIPIPKLVGNGTFRSKNFAAIPNYNAAGEFVFTGRILYVLLLIYMTNEDANIDYFAMQDYTSKLPVYIIYNGKQCEVTSRIRNIIRFLLMLESLELENQVIGEILAGEY